MKLRFKYDAANECFDVLAKRKSTGKWERIGTCHPRAVNLIKMGKVELIQLNIAALTDAQKMSNISKSVDVAFRNLPAKGKTCAGCGRVLAGGFHDCDPDTCNYCGVRN